MVSSLAAQLSQIAANSTKALDLKAQKAAHSKSLIFPPTVAASQSFESIYALCHEGFQELCMLDNRFLEFQRNLFSEQSQVEERTQKTAGENAELDRTLEAFLGLVGARLRLNPAIKAVEWLIRRFRIHEYNTTFLLTTFLPYHTLPIFTTVLSILPPKIPKTYQFLHPYVRSLSQPPRHTIVHTASNNVGFMSTLNSYVLQICKAKQQYQTLISFWAGTMTEAVSGMIDRSRSGRKGVQDQNEQDVALRILPTLNEGLSMRKVPELRIACYMLLSVMASKGDLNDNLLAAMMDAVALGWTMETRIPGLVCISVLAQHRNTARLPDRSVKELLKIDGLTAVIAELSTSHRVERLACGICLASIDRFGKTGKAGLLPIIRNLVEGGLLSSIQTTTCIKTLLLVANDMKFTPATDDTARAHLGDLLVSFGRASGRLETVVQEAIEASRLDIDKLELKLKTAFRPAVLPALSAGTTNVADEDAMVLDTEDVTNFDALHEKLSTRTANEKSFLTTTTSPLFIDLCQAFLVSIGRSKHLQRFSKSTVLRPDKAVVDALCISFFIRIWCGPYPTSAREAALHLTTESVKDAKDAKVDLQALIPYIVVALEDTAAKVRKAAAELLVAIEQIYIKNDESTKKQKVVKQWGSDDIYGDSPETKDTKWLAVDLARRLVSEILLPNLEECVLDRNHIVSLFEKCLNSSSKALQSPKKSETGFSKSHRTSLLVFFSSHIINSPIYTLKLQLLKCLNKVHRISTTSRTKVLLPALQQWATLSPEQAGENCEKEKLDQDEVDEEMTAIVVSSDKDGLDYLIRILKADLAADRTSLLAAVFRRLRNLWPSLKEDAMVSTAQVLLEISQSTGNLSEASSFAQEEAMGLLRTLTLSTETLVSFLNQLPTAADMVSAPPTTKRRRTSHGEISRLGLQDAELLKKTLKTLTFVLQLIDGSNPAQHPKLLKGLFNILAELQHFKAQAGSELGFMQGLVLSSLLSIMKAHKLDKEMTIDRSGVRADLLVDCVQKSTSPQIQNEALLLIASLAETTPELVLHSVMPIFTFMGNSVLHQNDEYSAHVIDQTIRQVIPPLIASLRKEKKDPALGAASLLLSFVAAYEHVPAHRRRGLFISLVRTLGPDDFLYALLAMLAHKYGASGDAGVFAVEVSSAFGVETQLQTVAKYLDLVSDVLKPNPVLSVVLLGLDDLKDADKSGVADRLLPLLPRLLSEKRMVQRTAKILACDDMDAARIRDMYSVLLEQILALAETLKKWEKNLPDAVGNVLESLLGLLSISEFVRSVENLLDQPNDFLRRKILSTIQIRIDQERQSDPVSRSALLGFLPQLTEIIRDSDDFWYRRMAVACVDSISKRYGKKDLEAVAAAAETIAGQNCLGLANEGLRCVALLCLTSLIDILGEQIVSILPTAMPKALEYIHASLDKEVRQERLHNAAFSFFSALVQHLPYMFTGVYLDNLLAACNASAAASFGSEADENRSVCLRIAAKQIDAKSMFAALDKKFEHTAQSGPQALGEYFEVLELAVEKHKRRAITESPACKNILLQAFDLRRKWSLKTWESPEEGRRVVIEKSINDIAIKMVYKHSKESFRPIFLAMVDWATEFKDDHGGRTMRLQSLYSFTTVLFDTLKSNVTSYTSDLLEGAVDALKNVDADDIYSKELWARVLQTLCKSFEHDQEDFWQKPAHFERVAPVMVSQFIMASTLPLEEYLVPAIVGLATAACSWDHHKELNTSILKHLRSEDTKVRLAAVQCQHALTDHWGEHWSQLLPEMIPYVSELMDDDDSAVGKATQLWTIKMEDAWGVSLDDMLK